MSFLNPLVLLGLIAAGIPLLLHLLNLRKLKTIEFSSLRFIKELQKTKIRKLKLQRILLLILRTLIVVFAVLAFARPVIKSELPVLGAHAKTSAIVILDNSFSMDASDEGGNRLKQAKNIATSIVAALKDGDEVAVLSNAVVNSDRKVAYTKNLPEVLDQISKLQASYTTTSMPAMMRIASALLPQAMHVNKEVYVISDIQRNVFANREDSVKAVLQGASVFVIPLDRSALSSQNLAVDSVSVQTKIFQVDKPVETEAFIRNASNSDAKGVVVSMMFDGIRVAQTTVDVSANSVQSALLSAPAQRRGTIKAWIEIEGDAIEQDNKRYFGFTLPPKPLVGVFGTETSFIQLVMNSPIGNEFAQARYVGANSLGSSNLSEFDMIVLCDGIAADDAPRVTQYLRDGGAVLLFASSSGNAMNTNSVLAQVGLGGSVSVEAQANAPLQFSSVDKQHPLFQGVFKGAEDSRSIVESPQITKALLSSGGLHVVSVQGSGFISESKLGDGKIVYCAVPPALGWSTFPLTGVFPALLFRSVSYCTQREQRAIDIPTGENFSYTLPKKFTGATSVQLIEPNGTQSARQVASLPSGSLLQLGVMESPGVYTIQGSNAEPISALSVNVQKTESENSYFTSKEFASELTNRTKETAAIQVLESSANVANNVARARIGTELWKLFIVLSVLCALAEMFVARSVKAEQ